MAGSCCGVGKRTAFRLKKASLVFFLAITPMSGCAEPSADFAMLFGPTTSRLSDKEKALAFAAFREGFSVSSDGTRLEDAHCGNLTPTTEVVDLNNDGTHEILVQWGNTCTSGMTGRSLTLLVKDAAGRYRPELGFPAFGWTPLSIGEGGWLDLSFGRPGFCHPVWARREGAYEFKCNRPESPGGCDAHRRHLSVT